MDSEVIKKTRGPTLYIIMYTDVPDMNPGKGIAQGAHAASKFVYEMLMARYERQTLSDEMWDYFNEWITQGDGFGTKVVLECPSKDIKGVISCFSASTSVGNIEDTTYPVKNWYGDYYVTVQDTCAFMFVPDPDNSIFTQFTKDMPLHR